MQDAIISIKNIMTSLKNTPQLKSAMSNTFQLLVNVLLGLALTFIVNIKMVFIHIQQLAIKAYSS